MNPKSRESNSSRSSRRRSKQPSQPREHGFEHVIYDPNSGHPNQPNANGKSSKHSNHHRRHQSPSRSKANNNMSGHRNSMSESRSPSQYRNDGERMKKKFRDAIYVGNFERVARIIKNILDNQTLDLTSVLLPYASRHVTPIGLAARRGHVQICKVLVEVIKEYVIKKPTETSRSEHEIDMEIVAEHETMLEILSREGRADNTSSGEKEEQKGTEEDEQQEVEDNGVVNDDSSSSISPQPVEQKKQIVSFSTLPNGKSSLMAMNKLNDNVDDNDNDVNMNMNNTNINIAETNKAQNHVDEYIADKKRTGKRRKKKSAKVIRSSSSDRLMVNTSDASPPPTTTKEAQSMMMQNDLMRNDATKVVRYHRKSQSMPYMQQMHLHEMLNRMDGENRTALSHACEKGQKEVIEFLLSEEGIAIEEGGKHHEESWTNLHWACRYGHHEIVQLLLNKGADINAQTSKKKSTGLHLACATGHTEVIRVLLENDAAKEIEDVYGCSPLSLAIHFGEKKVQQILYEAGIAVSPHDARRLKKDNHIFRRFHWIKIAPSISTKVELPDDMWCIVCGFLPCDELLLNVRLVSFGFLYVVHHPALRKLVNFKRSLPESPDELVQYNESHQTLVLKAPSPESNFNVNAAPFAFVPVGAVGFAPPPAAAAILGGAAAHHGLHGANGIAHPHGPAPPPHNGPAAGALTQMTNGAAHGGQPNPFGAFPHYMIPPPHHPHGAPASYPTAHQSHGNDNSHNSNNMTNTTTTSMTNDTQDLLTQLQVATARSGYLAHHYRNFLRPNVGRMHDGNDSSNLDMLAPSSTSTPTAIPLAIGSRPSNHVTFGSADFGDDDEDEKDNDGDEDEFTPPSFGGQTMMRGGLRDTQSVVRAVEEEWMGGHLNANLRDVLSMNSHLNSNNDNKNSNNSNDDMNRNNNDGNDNDNNDAPPSRPPVVIGEPLDMDNEADHDRDESSQSELQMSDMNGQLASLIFHHVTPREQEDVDQDAASQPPTHSIARQPSEELQPPPVPSDFADLRDIEPLTNLEPQSSDSLLQSLLPMGGDHVQAVLDANPTPMTRASSQVTAASQQHNRLGNNLQTIHYRQRSLPTSNALPHLVPDNVCDTNINGFPVSMSGINGLPGISAPPLLSRNYSHNNFVQANSDFQRLFARSPPISPSFGRSQTRSGINSNSVSGHNSLNGSPRHLLVSPMTHFSDFQQHVNRGMPPSQTSPENTNVDGDGDDSMMHIDVEEEQHDTSAMQQDGNDANGGQWREQSMMTMTNPMLQNNTMDSLFFGSASQHQNVTGASPSQSGSATRSASSSAVMAHTRDNSGSGWPNSMPVPPRYVPDNSVNCTATDRPDTFNALTPSRDVSNIFSSNLRRRSPSSSPSHNCNDSINFFHSNRRRGYGSMGTRSLLMQSRVTVMERLEELERIRGCTMNMDDDEEMDNDEELLMMDNVNRSQLEEKVDEDGSDALESQTWQYKHCLWLACAVNFGPANLRKIRLTGVSILSQPLIRVLSCLSFIVHLELAHFHAYTLTTMDLKQLSRVSQLKMIRQLKVFPVIRNNSYRAAMYDACAVATFITQIGSTALTLGIKYESIDIDEAEEKAIAEHMKRFDAHILSANGHGNSPKVKAIECPQTELDSANAVDDDAKERENESPETETVLDVDSTDVDTALLSSLTWKSLFDHLPSNLRSLRLHFGKDDSLKRGAVHGLKNFESIKCFTLHGDPGLYGQIEEWSDVFKRWNKLRYIVLGHRNNTKELQVPKEILNALPPMLPELALNISVHSIPNVVWYLKHVVRAECFLRINLHVVHKHKSDLYHASIHPEIIPCLTRFHNLETAYLKCGMVTLEQIELLLQRCIKVSFVGFGIDASDEKQVLAFRLLLEDYGFDKIVVKNKLNWLIAVKSYDKLLLDPTRCIHPVLEAFDEKSCQIMSSLKRMGPKGKSAMALHSRTESQIQSLDD